MSERKEEFQEVKDFKPSWVPCNGDEWGNLIMTERVTTLERIEKLERKVEILKQAVQEVTRVLQEEQQTMLKMLSYLQSVIDKKEE